MTAPPWVSASKNQTSVNYSQEEENYDLSSLEPSSTRKQHSKFSIVGGAALAGTAVGMTMVGPVIGLISGIVAATIATKDTKAGDVARSTGETVLTAGDQIRDLDERHHIVEKTKWGVGSLFGRAKEIDENHKVVEKTKTGFGNAVNKAKEVDENHGISERTNDGLKRHFGFINNVFRRGPDCNYTPWPDHD